MATIAQQFAEICAQEAARDARTYAPKYPNGFFRAVSRSGKDVGNGFYCADCKLLYLDHAPASITHCRRTDRYEPFTRVSWLNRFCRLFMKRKRI